MPSFSAWIFRLRIAVHMTIYLLGFFAPWDRLLPEATSLSTWLVLAAALTRQGWASFTGATVGVLVAATVLATSAAALRTWATAWMGQAVVAGASMQAERVVADGPYRHMRNPLYVGLVMHTVALSILMPPTGAIFAIVATTLYDIWLSRVEGQFLQGRLGAAYDAYRRAVPAVLPSIRPRCVPSGRKAKWGQAFLGELYFWGVVVSFVVLGWKYNAFLLQRGVLVALGCALVVRAMLPKTATPAA